MVVVGLVEEVVLVEVVVLLVLVSVEEGARPRHWLWSVRARHWLSFLLVLVEVVVLVSATSLPTVEVVLVEPPEGGGGASSSTVDLDTCCQTDSGSMKSSKSFLTDSQELPPLSPFRSSSDT